MTKNNSLFILIVKFVKKMKVDGIKLTTEIGDMKTPSRELFLESTSSMNTQAVLYTDDNGLEIVKRTNAMNTKEIIAANYFPVVQR